MLVCDSLPLVVGVDRIVVVDRIDRMVVGMMVVWMEENLLCRMEEEAYLQLFERQGKH